MKQYKEKKLYQYVITVDFERWPRKLAEELIDESRTLDGHLVSVTDLQNDKHVYGATWQVDVPLVEQVIPEKLKRIQEEMGIK
jgi:hypothetical protein